MIKRFADWLETMSVGFILAGIFQQILSGKFNEGFIAVGVGGGFFIFSLLLTYIDNKKK